MLASNTEEQPVPKKAKTNPQDVETPPSPNLQTQSPVSVTTPIATAGSHNSPPSNVTYVQQNVIPNNHHSNNPKVAITSHPMWNGNGHAYSIHPRQALPASNVLQHPNGVTNPMHSMPTNTYVNSPQGYIPMSNSAKIGQVNKYVILFTKYNIILEL